VAKPFRVGELSARAQRLGQRTTPPMLRRIALPLLIVELGALFAGSFVQYKNFDLSFDFGAYYQAWWLIGHGHLDPYSTMLGVRFVANDSELIMWPLALLDKISSSPLVLLFIEDLAIVATNAATLAWVREILDAAALERVPSRVIEGFALTSLVLDPWCYETALWAFHVETFVALFAVLAGRGLWRGQLRSVGLWGPMLLLCGLTGALALVGLGLSGLLVGGDARRLGAVSAVAGVLSIGLASYLHLVGVGGSLAPVAYGYLLPSHQGSVGPAMLVVGLVAHAGRALHVLAGTLPAMVLFLIPSGLFGVVNRWAVGVAVALSAPALLADGPVLHLNDWLAFQIWPVLPFALVGSVLFLCSVSWGGGSRVRLGQLLAGGAFALLAATGVAWFPRLWAYWIPLHPREAMVLDDTLRAIPERAEVIAWGPLSGRFGARSAALGIRLPRQYLARDREELIFVLGPGDIGVGAPAAAEQSFARQLERDGETATVVHGGGVTVLAWRPATETQGIWYPTARTTRRTRGR